jgi:heme/copper-type cytochrome/quinol oxidase subunit 4
MAKRIVPWLPWVLAEGTLGFLEAQFWPAGGLWLLLIWTAVLLLYRAALVMASGRSARVVGDLAFAGLCVLAVFEGGWYLLPAVVAFAACDAAGLTIELPSPPNDRGGYELGAALACALLGWLGLAISVSGPIYASASSTVSANSVVVNSPPEVSLLQAGLTTQTALLLIATAALFGLVTLAALLHVRTGRPDAWRGLVAVTVALVALVVLSTMTVGLWLVPGGALALVAVQVGRPVRPSARRPVMPSSTGNI